MLDVLIVDDSAAIRKILQRVLRQADVPVGTVFEARDGIEALATLRWSEERPDMCENRLPRIRSRKNSPDSFRRNESRF
jgi:CheY-like chemotaxis protein